MKNKKKYNHYPMLYIAQPDLKAPEASMQSGYRSPKVTKAAKSSSVSDDVSTKHKREGAEGSAEAAKRKRVRGKRKFNDMSVREKVQYFISLPSQVPKMKCEIVTESNTCRGLITDYKDGIVYINAAQPPYKRKVQLSEITDIQLLGF